jgi:hypothetical protein
MTKKLNIGSIIDFPIKTEILENNPAAGDTTIFTAYSDPSKEANLNEIVIQRTIIKANTPSTGDTDITDEWAITSTSDKDPLVFNKKWKNRLTYDYSFLQF